MPSLSLNTILIVDPNKELTALYHHFPTHSHHIHVMSTQRATQYLQDQTPDLVIISASYSPPQIINLLDIMKTKSSNANFLIPLIIAVDLKNKANYVPGTHWGEKIGLLCNLSSKNEVNAVLNRICAAQKNLGY